MASKERKGGVLHNDEIEKELERTGANQPTNNSYRGTQDTGDEVVRDKGTKVQQQDGVGPAESPDEE
jgi:hypothetical protein